MERYMKQYKEGGGEAWKFELKKSTKKRERGEDYRFETSLLDKDPCYLHTI